MIEMPRRSVTRFFIPLIDVMILLFCIFLLLPIFKENDPENPDVGLKKKLQQSDQERKKSTDELEAYRQEQIKMSLPRLFAVRVLEIEPSQAKPGRGELLYYEKGKSKPEVIDSEGVMTRLVNRHRRELEKKYPPEQRPELNYLILWPRENPLYPLQGELENYERWLKANKVKYTLDRRGGDGT